MSEGLDVKYPLELKCRRLMLSLMASAPGTFCDPSKNLLGSIAQYDEEFSALLGNYLPDLAARIGVEGSWADFALRQAFNARSSMADLLVHLSKNRLFDLDFSVSEFHNAWFVMRGFDVDGLIHIGSDSKIEPGRDLTRVLLGRRYLESQKPRSSDGENRSAIFDNHVHFGQMIDLNLIWAMQICSRRLYPIFNLDRVREIPNKLRPSIQRMSEGDLQQKLICCRAIFWACFERRMGKRDEVSIDRLVREIKELIFDSFPEGGLRRTAKFASELIEKDINVGQVIESEQILLNGVIDSSRGVVHGEERIVYLLLKNSFFNDVLQNSVSTFPQFTERLKDLDLLYRGIFDCLNDFQIFSSVRRIMMRSGSAGGSVKFRFNPTIRRVDFSAALERLRGLARGVVFALKRDDVAYLDNRRTKELLGKIVRFAAECSEYGLEFHGLDLIGPETVQEKRGIGPDIGQTSIEVTKETIDFIFMAREKIRSELAINSPVAFHCGEYYVDARVSLLTIVQIVCSPCFLPGVDRISHALVLHEKVRKFDVSVNVAEIDYTITILRESILRSLAMSGRDSHLLSKRQKNDLVRWINTICSDVEWRVTSRCIANVQRLLRRLVASGQVLLELCPSSNAMIRGDIVPDVCRHPWAELVGSDAVLIGTDDPSLTQTLVWMEHALVSAH